MRLERALIDTGRALALRLVLVALFMLGMAHAPVPSGTDAPQTVAVLHGADGAKGVQLFATEPREIESFAFGGGEDERGIVTPARPAWPSIAIAGGGVTPRAHITTCHDGFHSRAPPSRA
jgi:hypothetical protein